MRNRFVLEKKRCVFIEREKLSIMVRKYLCLLWVGFLFGPQISTCIIWKIIVVFIEPCGKIDLVILVNGKKLYIEEWNVELILGIKKKFYKVSDLNDNVIFYL